MNVLLLPIPQCQTLKIYQRIRKCYISHNSMERWRWLFLNVLNFLREGEVQEVQEVQEEGKVQEVQEGEEVDEAEEGLHCNGDTSTLYMVF